MNIRTEWVIACDGGATGTRVGLYRKSILTAETQSGPANPVEYGMTQCIRALQDAIDPIIPHEAGLIIVSVSGCARGSIRNETATRLAEIYPQWTIAATDDLHPILVANAGRDAAVLAVAGTGSSILAQDGQGKWAIIGGRGHVFGDDGGAYQVAVSALRAAADAVDGLGPETRLTEAICEAVGVADFAAIPAWTGCASKQAIAALARTVNQLAETGDTVATACLCKQARALARQTTAAARKLAIKPGVPVYGHGSLFTESHIFRTAFIEAVKKENVQLQPVKPTRSGHAAAVTIATYTESWPEWVSVATVEEKKTQVLPGTEQLNQGIPLDELDARSIAQRMNEEDTTAVTAVATQLDAIATCINAAATAIQTNKRIIYIGAGTSGRLGVLDASECPPTFGADPGTVLGIIAGGDIALRKSIEGAEDDTVKGYTEIAQLIPQITIGDVVVGITASGTTPYVRAALKEAKIRGATTALLCCNPIEKNAADIVIAVETGPEVVAGSTRLKAGTATKLVLNMISTGAFALAGYVYKGYMAGVQPVNTKLHRRAIRIVSALTNCTEEQANTLLEQAGWDVRKAIIMIKRQLDAKEAAVQLAAKGSLRDTLDEK